MKYQNEFWATPKEVTALKTITDGAKLVYGILYTRKNGDQIAWPSQSYIAEAIGKTPRSVLRHIQELEAVNLIQKTRVGKTATNRYELKSDVTDFHITTAKPVTSRGDNLSHPIVREQDKRISKIAANAADDGFNNHHEVAEYLNKILNDPITKPDIHIIATFVTYKGINPGETFQIKNKKDFSAIVARNVKVAKRLATTDPGRVEKTMQILSELAPFDWTLENVEKYMVYSPEKLRENLASMTKKKVYA